MTSENTTAADAPRCHWLAVLARASEAQLDALAPSRDTLPTLQWIRAAEIGMVMLRARAGGTGEPFNLGEASVTRCALRLGAGPLGVGYTLGRQRHKAELIALFDALLQEPERQAQLMTQVIAPLEALQRQARDAASAATAQSRVEFFTIVRGEA